VKQEQWERWRAKRKLVSESKQWGRFCSGPGASFLGKIVRLYTQNPAISCIFGGKMIHNAVHNAFLNTLTMGTAFPLEMTLAAIASNCLQKEHALDMFRFCVVG